jgi:hypothetical protein
VIKPVFNFPYSAVWAALDVQGPKDGYQPQLSDIVQPVVIVADVGGNVDTTGLFADQTTRDNAAYSANAFQNFNVAQPAKVQLKNPTGSGVHLYVDRIKIKSSAGAAAFPRPVNVGFLDASYATLLLQGTNRNLASGPFDAIDSVQVGRAEVRAEAAADAPLSQVLIETTDMIAATEWKTLDFNPPIRLGPGRGLAVRVGNDSSINAAFFWREYAQ